MKVQLIRAVLSLSLCFAAGASLAWTPEVNRVYVDDEGRLSQNPVVLHQPEVRNWLADPDYTNSFRRYAYKDLPMITEIVRGGEVQCFTNLCPGSNYTWSVGGFHGTFTTERQAPRTLLARIGDGRYGYVRNFRDLGGLRLINSSKRTKFGVYFRSEKWELHYEKNQRQGNPMHAEFGIKSEIDLRYQDKEVGAEIVDAEGNVIAYNSETTNTLYTEKYRFVKDWFKSSYSPGYEFTTSPSLPAGDGSVRYFMCSLAEGAINRNYNINFISNISRVFSVLGNSDMLPSLFHCTSGKDRTGWVAILIEALCGVREADIRRDYLLSYFSGVGYPSASYEGELKGQLYLGNHYNDGYDYGDKYGTSLAGRARSYLEHFGVTYEQIKTITMSLVGETPEQVLARVNGAADADEPDELNGTVTVGIPRAGTKVTNPTVLARGGDEVYQISQNGVDYFVHYFTNTTSELVFTNNSDRAFDVSYLVVGGGGAGGATADGAFGGGGGAGGGVSASANTVTMAVNEKWTVTVGRGGRAAGTGVSASAAMGSSISGGAIASAAAGGSGYSASASGAGAGGNVTGRSGGAAKTISSYPLAGGGAGAGGNGVTPSAKAVSGDGGPGVVSDISGFKLTYGAGGGGGGGTIAGQTPPFTGCGDNEGVIPGKGANGGGRGGAFQIKVDHRGSDVKKPVVYQLSAAQGGIAGTGAGGGGAGASGAAAAANLVEVTNDKGEHSGIDVIGGNDAGGTKVRAGDGGDGIVIIRYAASDSEEASAFDPNLKHENPDVDETAYDWYDLDHFLSQGFFEGLAFTEASNPVRLPDSVSSVNVTGGEHKTDLAGVQLRFKTKGKFVIKWQPPNDGVDYERPYMSPTPVSGVDVYEFREEGYWRYKTTGRVNFTNKPTMIVVDWSSAEVPCLINLPLLNHFGSFSIGISKGSSIASAPAHKNGITKPVVFYGGSAVQGVGAARPGLAYVNIVGRELDVPVVNLGLQNGGRMESVMATAAASIDASCFVIDSLAEMTLEEVQDNYESFLTTIHTAHPSMPIVLVEAYDAYGATERTDKENVVHALYEKYKAQSGWNLVYVSKTQLSKGDGEGIFLNGYLDTIGMREMADALDDVLSTTLGISRSVPKRQAFIDYTTGVSADWKIDNSEFKTPTFDFSAACAHATTEDGVSWFDGKDLPLEGCAFTDVARYFDRYPAVLSTDMTMDGGRVLQRDTASEQFRFRTDSSQLRIKWKTYDNELSLFQMPMTSCSGIDVYRFDKTSGKWVYKTSGTVTAWRETELVTDWTPGEACLINLPLYNGIDHIKIGLDADAEIEALGTRASGVNKPVVIYGTSITQGNAPSRPGLAFVNRVGRDLDVPILNYGFSGSGVMEPQVVEHLASIDASCYVIDSIWNLRSVENICDKYKPFVRELRRLRPDVPIVLAGMAYAWGGTPDPYEQEVIDFYNELVSEGWKGIYFLPKTEMYPSNYYDSTVDGTHPTDEGMETMAMAYGAAIQRALTSTTYGQEDPDSDPGTYLASGGDSVYDIIVGDDTYWVHEFTSTDSAKRFTNKSDVPLEIEYLVVGGGGAGGDSQNVNDTSSWGGGGGAGGVVVEGAAEVGANAVWMINVGAGGKTDGVRSGMASTMASNTVVIVTAVGGSAGGNCGNNGVDGVLGGGAGGGKSGGTGTLYSGGNGGSYKFGSAADNAVSGGGAGAGAAGGSGVVGSVSSDKASASGFKSGDGGNGVSSSITGGEAKWYGGGGGGGGGIRNQRISLFGDTGVTPGNGGNGGGGKGGDAKTAAVAGTAGTGGGGGGAGGQGGTDKSAISGAAGGSGIVIIRYKAVDPVIEPVYYDVTFKSNTVTISTIQVEENTELTADRIPDFGAGEWNDNPTNATIVAATTFDFTSLWKVSFVSNGVVRTTVDVLNGGTLKATDIPDFGEGVWTVTPDTSTVITGDVTFSFTPSAPPPEDPEDPGDDPVLPGGQLADGGDYVHKEKIGGVDYWIHEFSNGTTHVTFRNTSGDALPVEYLVVGGGGAGGDGFTGYGGGGGGGGGGVIGDTETMSANAIWKIFVGNGGGVTNGGVHIACNDARGKSGASAISNYVGNVYSDIATAPGGGAGGCSRQNAATIGAAGGGGSGRGNEENGRSANGNFTSRINGKPSGEEKHKGGKGFSGNVGGAGGGGGARYDGVDGSESQSGNGGDGVPSSITGREVIYGGGGGGGGRDNVAPGSGCNGGNGGSSSVLAQAGASGSGNGGGGGYPHVGATEPGSAGAGGSGIVIIRYVAGTAPDPEPVMCNVTFTSNTVSRSSVEIEKDAQLAADKIPDFGRGEWDSNPTNATIVADTNFNFTSIWKVTFSTNDVNVSGTESTARNGEAPAPVPVFTDGSWDVDPSAADVICDTNFNYTIAAEPPPAVEMPFAVIGTDTDSVISFTGSVTEDHLVDGKVYVKAGEKQVLGAVDTTGKTCCGCWRDDATGELFWGETVEVTPTEPTTYTACFGPKWDLWYDTTNKYYHLDNGIWDFKAEITNDDEIIVGKFVGDSSRFTDDGQLRLVNFATPVEGTGFSGLKIAYFSNYTTEPTTGYAEIFEKSTDSTRVHRNDYKLPEMLLLPDTTKEIDVMAFKNLMNIRGVLCIPENVKIYHQAFASDGSLEGLIFKGGVDGGQTFEDKTYLISKNKENPNVLKDHASTGNQFEQCHRLAGGVVLPRSITYIPPNCFYWCESLGAIDLTYVTNVMDRGLYNCHSLSNIVALESLESVGFMACCGCYSLAGDLNFTNLETEAFCAFGNCGITSVKLPKVTTINYGLFVNTPVTNIVFSEQAVTFACNEDDDKPQWPYESDELGKAYCTNAISTRCWLEFPGAAPILTNFANRTTALWLFGVRNSEDGQPQDKIMPELCLHGEFERDREGWEKIYAEIGNPMPYNSERPKQSIPDDIGVYGFVNWQDEYEFTKDKKGNVLSQGFTPSTTKAYLVFTLKGLYFFVK